MARNLSPLRAALFFSILFVCALCSQPSSKASSAQDDSQGASRGLTVKKELPVAQKRYALVIGVDAYDDQQINRLSGAANDARSLAAALVQHAGFPSDQVILLSTDQPRERQPTRGNILKRLANLRGAVPQDGLLLVSFAGHGIQHEGRAFLLPSDAQTGDLTLLEDTTINVETVRERVQQTGVRQVIMILDACRNSPSGRGDVSNLLSDSYIKAFDFYQRNRDIEAFATLYATEVGHRAYEYTERKHGYFTWALVEGLKGGAANELGEVTLAGLVSYLQEQVPKRIHLDLGREKKQRPWADVQGYKADELVLALAAKSTAKSQTTAASSTTTATDQADTDTVELSFWNSIKNSKDTADFREYLKKYPKGKFAGLAKNKIRQLENKQSIIENEQPVIMQPPPNNQPMRKPGRPPVR